jgi:glycosyltransferase involved in cell wall biosynthesis
MNICEYLLRKKLKGNTPVGHYLVNIVIPKSGGDLSEIGKLTAQHCRVSGVRMKTSYKADPNAIVNYYCDISNTYFGEKTNLDIGYVTQTHIDSQPWLSGLFNQRNVFANLDGIVCVNEGYKKLCKKVGFPEEKLITLTPGQISDTFHLRTITIGIVSRGGYPGKGQQFMEVLFAKYDLTGFRFRFLGNGWDAVLPIAKAKHIDVELLSDADYSMYPKFYHDIDYHLIPGLWEAGPMSFQESLASGIPVISADIGFAGYEFQPDYIFPPGNTKRLYAILQRLRKPLLQRRKQVEGRSWEKYARQLVAFFKKMEKMKNLKKRSHVI